MDESTRDPPHPGQAAAAYHPPAEAFSIQKSNFSSGFLSPEQCLRAFDNIKRSSAPSRFLLFAEDAWSDVDHQVFDHLKAGFLAGKTTFEVPVDGKTYIFDFIGMSRIDRDNGRQNSIAWMDVDGRCFFPRNAVEENADIPRKIQRKERIHKNLLNCHGSQEVSSAGFSKQRWPGAVMLSDDDSSYKVMKKLFLSGMKPFASDTLFITSINSCSDSIPPNKLSSFHLHMRLTAEARGNGANLKFGWHGASASNIAAILSHGFGQQHMRGMMGLAAHGVGIHFASSLASHVSAMQTEADDRGERHMVLCRIILGNSEKIELGSTQDHPSNEGYDSGVDDPVNPKWYVVWSHNMNTHILPEFIVSFKYSTFGRSEGKIPFSKLLSEVGKSLPASAMQALELSYQQFKEGKVSKETIIRNLKSMAGDDLLTSTIKRLKATVQGLPSTV